MNLKRHLAFVQDLLYSRRDITLEELLIEETEPEQAGIIEGRLRYWDGSLFKFVEQLAVRGAGLTKTRYAYHYQDGDGVLVFRYDNVAHYPEIATYPHHKHVRVGAGDSNAVIAALPPSLAEVLREIDIISMGRKNRNNGAYGWGDLDLGHGFHATAQGVRYTISEPARRQVLGRLLELNHARYAAEVAAGLHEKKRAGGEGRGAAAEPRP